MTVPGMVSVIVLNWNGKRIICDCLDSLLRQTYKPLEIIVVDNGSKDGSLEMIREKYGSRFVILENGCNLGFAEGCNVGIRKAQGEFIVLVNSDATLKEDWTEEMVKAVRKDPQTGMVAGKIYFAGREGILENTGHVVFRDGMARGRGRLERDKGQYDKMDRIFCPNGCAALYRKAIMEEAGLFDAEFFAYADDIDVGFRIRMLGYECVYAPQAIAYHELSGSFGMLSPLKAYLLERNRLWVLIKCFPLPHLAIAPFYTIQRYCYHLYGMLRKKGPAAHYAEKISTFSLMWIALKVYLSTLRHLPYLLRERRKVMKKCRISIEEFECWLRLYGMTAREVALNEISYTEPAV